MIDITTFGVSEAPLSVAESQQSVCCKRNHEESLVSILIPSYVRTDDLRNTLHAVVALRYSNKEIIVVDDSTPDGSIEQVVASFPEVKYLRTPKNLGLIGARNFGAAHCSGDFIVNLDDDSWLEDSDALELITAFMCKYPNVGVAALNIGLSGSGYLWSMEEKPTKIKTYKGCGNVYRRAALLAVGDYICEFFRQGEELERSLRIMDAGFEIRSAPHIRVFHSQSTINRNWPRHLAYEAANYLRRELIRAPLWLLPFGCARALRFVLIHRKDMDYSLYFSEIFGRRVPIFAFLRRHRAPVRTSTYLNAMRLP